MATPTFATQAAAAGAYPAFRFNKREQKLLASIQAAVGAPTHYVKFAGTHTTVGGAAAEAKTITGLLSTDLVFVQMKAQGASPQTILKAVPTADTLTVTFSANPSSDHVFYYQVLRAL